VKNINIKSSFKPAWWLNNSHLQTIYPSLFRIVRLPHTRRERFFTSDHDFFDVDWLGEEHHPIIILLHGLTGSSQSGYIKGMQKKLTHDGFRTAALNFRGCSGELNHRARCYHSGETEDLDLLYTTLREREPNMPIGVVGFSLGGNVLLKWLGESAKSLFLFAAVAVSVPLQLSICATTLDKGFAKLYRYRLISELKQFISDKKVYLEVLGLIDEAYKITNLGDISQIKSFWQYDDQVVAKLHSFKDAQDYYHQSSSQQFLKLITVSTLIIHAIDDPFMTPEVLPNKEQLSDFVSLEVAKGGGHVGFISGKTPFKPVYWLDQRIPEFLKSKLLTWRPSHLTTSQ